ARLFGAAYRDQDDGLAARDEARPGGLLGDSTRLQRDGLVADLDTFSDDHRNLTLSFALLAAHLAQQAMLLGNGCDRELGPRFQRCDLGRSVRSEARARPCPGAARCICLTLNGNDCSACA